MNVKKGKPNAVLLHGLGGSKADWKDVETILSRSFKVLRLDLPGAGGAPKPDYGYEPDALARAVSSAMKAAGIECAHIIGHSVGARVAGELAACEPSCVDRLVLVSPLGAVTYSLADKLKWKAMSRRGVLQSVPESSMRNASAYGFAVESPGKKAFIERALAARTGPEGAAIARAVEKTVDGVLGAPPLVERLKGTKAPLLVLAGALDPLAPPDDSRALKIVRPDATFVELPRLGHYPMLEDPRRVADALRDFLLGS
jgi:pimeloyl-ACP methyl ester carboxylesterase